MNYDSMPAGYEMDRMIGEKVMGFTYVSGHWRPSNDIAQAWEVVEKLRSKGVTMIVFPYRTGWVCSFIDGDIDCDRVSHDFHYIDCETADTATADTPPLAICRAALKAVGK